MNIELDKSALHKLYRYALALSGNEEDAFDLLQSSLEKLLKIPSDTITHPMAYVRRSIKNLYIDNYRKEQKYTKVDLLELDTIHINDEDALNFDRILVMESEFNQCWELMSTDERELMFLFAVEGYTVREIAEQSNTPVGTLLARIHRIKQKIRNMINAKNLFHTSKGVSR